jgi:hypothetical protein
MIKKDLENTFNTEIYQLYQDFGFIENDIQFYLETDNPLYFKNQDWNISHELKPHDSFKYSFRFELFKGYNESYFDIKEYIWHYNKNYDVNKNTQFIKNLILNILKDNLKQEWREIQLNKLV